MSIEERLKRLEDAEEIRRLVQQYRQRLDDNDLVAYGRLFAADGEWLGGTGYGKSPAGITAMLQERLAPRTSDRQSSWHLLTDPVITVRGDRATGQLTWALVVRGEGDVPVLRLLGRYEDSYVREHGQWRFLSRIAQPDIPHRELKIPAGWGEHASAAAYASASGHASADGHAGADGQEPAAGDVAVRLRRLEDLEQIRQLFTEYQTALDRQDFAAYAALFAADGEFATGSGLAKGRAAIQALVAAMPGTLLGTGPGEDRHVIVNPLIELDPDNADRARAELAWLYVVKNADGGPTLAKFGHYADDLIREEGRWCFLRRQAATDVGRRAKA
jgi:uncharacterized protein (TIGR02246 family)